MIWHIFKKDVRLLWQYALAFTVLQSFETFVRYRMDDNAPDLGGLWQLLEMCGLLGAGLLIAAVVQLDAIPGVRQDWLVRPIQRRDLLCAKLLFVILLVQGPVFLTNWVGTMAHGFSSSQSLGAAFLFSLTLLAGYYIPMLAVASLTRNVTGALVAVLIGGCLYAASEHLTSGYDWFRFMFYRTGANWLLNWTIVLILLAGAAAILAIQYTRRKTSRARELAVSIAVLCIILVNAPWQPVFAIQQHLSPSPGAASSIRMTFQPSLGASALSGNNPRRARLAVPVFTSGLPSDAILLSDWGTASLTGADGKTVHLGRTTGDRWVTGDAGTYTSVWIPDDLYARLKDRPARLEIDYSLTLLRLSESHAIPAVADPQLVPGLGRCGSKVNAAGTAVLVNCVAAGASPSCATFFLEHASSGKRNPVMTHVDPDYAPFFAQMTPDAMQRFEVAVPFHELGKDSRVVMRIFKPADHFTRQVIIPDIHLADWVAQAQGDMRR